MIKPSMMRLHSRLKMRHMLLLRLLKDNPNIRRAAIDMNVSQPSASALLREIEDAVGCALFLREAHGLRATAQGTAMIEWAAIILADIERASDDLERIALGAGSRVRVGVSPLAVTRLLPDAVRQFRTNSPNTVISVITGIEDTLIPMVLEGQIDVAVNRLVPDLVHSGLNYEILCSEPACVTARRGHPLADKDVLSAKDLDHFEWILPVSRGAPYDRIGTCLVNLGAKLPRVVIETWSVVVQVHLLEESDYLTVMPRSVAEGSPTLKILPLTISDDLYPVVLLTRPLPDHAVILSQFVEALRHAARSPSGSTTLQNPIG